MSCWLSGLLHVSNADINQSYTILPSKLIGVSETPFSLTIFHVDLQGSLSSKSTQNKAATHTHTGKEQKACNTGGDCCTIKVLQKAT